MLSRKCFTREWVDAKRLGIGGDPILLEKTIHAFALLSHLVQRGVPLVFKGGTSLLLRIPRPKRLSIDVDILCPLPDQDLNPMPVVEVRSSTNTNRCWSKDGAR